MAYQYSTNQTPLTGAEAIYNIKATLKNAGWTVPRSSDGTTYNSSGDQISSAGTGANGMANDRAWFVIQAPGAVDGYTRQLCVQHQNSGSTHTSWRIKYSNNAAFTGGSPGATQTPSASDEQILLGSGSDASPGFTGLYTTDNTYRYNVAADSSSPYSFWAIGFPTGGGNPNTVFWMDGVQQTTSLDNDKYIFYVTFSTTCLNSTNSVLQAGQSSTSPSSQNQPPYGYIKKGLSGEGFVNIPGVHYWTNNGNNIVAPAGVGTNPHSGLDDLYPLMYARQSSFTSPIGYKGISNFCTITGVTRSTGDTITVSSSSDHVVFGSYIFNWDGSTPLV